MQLLFCEDTETGCDSMVALGCFCIEVRRSGGLGALIELLSPDCGTLLSSSDASSPIV